MIKIKTYRKIYHIPHHSNIEIGLGGYKSPNYNNTVTIGSHVLRFYKSYGVFSVDSAYDHIDNTNSILVIGTRFGEEVYNNHSPENELLHQIIVDIIKDWNKDKLIPVSTPMLNDSMHTILTLWEESKGKSYNRDTQLNNLLNNH